MLVVTSQSEATGPHDQIKDFRESRVEQSRAEQSNEKTQLLSPHLHPPPQSGPGWQRGRPGAGSVPQDDGGDELETGGEEG